MCPVALPTAQLFPFANALHWPSSINGVAMSSYHRWMEVTAIGTLINAPTLAAAWESQASWMKREPALLG